MRNHFGSQFTGQVSVAGGLAANGQLQLTYVGDTFTYVCAFSSSVQVLLNMQLSFQCDNRCGK